jgi:CRP-like cAMP-binding protein
VASTDYLDHLRGLRLFGACSDKELEQIARLSDEITVATGINVIEQGSVARDAYVIIAGTAEVLVDDVVVATLGPGQQFGEVALLDGGPRTATIRALTTMNLLVIQRRAFMGLLDEQPGLARRIMSTMAGIIRDLESSPHP